MNKRLQEDKATLGVPFFPTPVQNSNSSREEQLIPGQQVEWDFHQVAATWWKPYSTCLLAAKGYLVAFELNWWGDERQKHRYPRLTNLSAADVL